MPDKPNSKRTGEISEAAFLHKAVTLGFKVTKPWGDSERYDFVLDAGSRLWRVQIKSTSALHAGGYQIQPIHYVYGVKKLAYTSDEIDALAAHIVPLDVWYILPVSALGSGTSLRLYPHGNCKTARFERFREAWRLFGEHESRECTALDPSAPAAFDNSANPAEPSPPDSPSGAATESSDVGVNSDVGETGDAGENWVRIETPSPHWKPLFPPIFARYLARRESPLRAVFPNTSKKNK